MIFLLGASCPVGRAFADELFRRGHCFVPLTREAFDYTKFEYLFDYVRKMKPEFLINAAGFSGKPNVDSCEFAREETLWANTLLPQTIARVCVMTNTPWGHVSSASIYSGAKIVEDGKLRIEKNLNRPAVRELYQVHPEKFYGFAESDQPNFTFRNGPCNFYSGTKALAEEAIRNLGQNYIWRIGDTFNEKDEPHNLLSKLQGHYKIHDTLGSLSQLDEAVRACLDLWESSAAFGTYHVANSGAISTREIVEMTQEILLPAHSVEFWKDDDEFYNSGHHVLRSHAILNVAKLLANGIRMRPVRDAVEDSLRRWRSDPSTVKEPAMISESLPVTI